MKKAMLVLGIIGALIALVGSLVTMVGGFGGTAIGVAGNSDATAYSGTFVFWSGALAVVTAALALIFSVVGGLSRKKVSILAFAAGTTAAGLLSIYLYNWFSGAIVTTAGILGLLGAKTGEDDGARLFKSAAFYAVMLPILLLTAVSATVKNGKTLVTDEAPPFLGTKSFNFYGGAGTAETATISRDGTITIERHGYSGSSVTFSGKYAHRIETSDGTGYLFKDGKIYSLDKGRVATGCQDAGSPCVSDLYEP